MGELGAVLIGSGILPPGSALPEDSVAAGADCLPLLVDAWTKSLVSQRHPGPASEVSRLSELRDQGARLTFGVPGAKRARGLAWLGPRLFLWPPGSPPQRRVGLISSRLGHDLDSYRPWFTMLRAAAMKLDPRREVLLTAGRTTAQRFVRRCGALFGVRVLQIEFPVDAAETLAAWWRNLPRLPVSSSRECQAIHVSPRLPLGRGSTAALGRIPEPDRAVAALSDQLMCLHARPGGNVEQLLYARLSDPDFPPATVYVAVGSPLLAPELASRLLGRGAVGWLALAAAEPSEAETAPSHPAMPLGEARELDQGFLTHCTRRRRGPWPGQSEDQFLDDLILDREGADHSAFATLWRIVRAQRLLASAQMVRGGVPVVSVSAVPPAELPSLRTYRSHLGRWDFEPYGIAIRRPWLESRGTRPVIYGDETTWAGLSADERPFFQPRHSRSSRGRLLDWTGEREWRHVGDLPLDALPSDAAVLFVPSQTEAGHLATISRWPVLVAPAPIRR